MPQGNEYGISRMAIEVPNVVFDLFKCQVPAAGHTHAGRALFRAGSDHANAVSSLF
jgi:hypothetical protein